jgi:hypothetical protein
VEVGIRYSEDQLPLVNVPFIIADAHNLGIFQNKPLVIIIFLQRINAKIIYKKCDFFLQPSQMET